MVQLTFSMDATPGMNVLVAVYIGGISGGLISAILLNMPGTASSIATTFDGHPMAQKGEATTPFKGANPDGMTVLYGHNLVNVAKVAGVTDYDYTAFKCGPTFAKDPAQQLYVNPEKYKDLNEFLEAAKAAPGTLKACTEVGAYTYYELLALENLAGIDLDLVDA